MKITESGLYADMSNGDYHEQHDWLSSSYLKSLLPERYKPAGGSQDALDFGSLLHAIILEPETIDGYPERNGLTILDAQKLGVKADGKSADNPTATKAWKDAVAAATQGGKRVITQTDWDAMLVRAEAMAEAVRQHDVAADLLFGRDGHVEESAFAEVGGIQCRARFDRRIPGIIADLKSTSTKPGADSIARAVIDYGYDLSAAHYLAVADALGLDAAAFALVFVSKTEPYYVTVAELDDAFLERGYALRARAIARHLKEADAYDGATGFLTLDCPRWAQIGDVA